MTRPFKIPESVLVVIHTPEREVLLIERADAAGFWQSVTGSKDHLDEALAATCAREVAEETGIVRHANEFIDWQLANVYEIYPAWAHRYDQPPTTGWGGRSADLLNAVANPGGNISMSVSLNGANTFEVGNVVSQYHVSSTGAVTLSNLTPGKIKSMQNILGLAIPNLQRTAYADVMDRAVATGQLLNTSIQATAMATDAPPGTWVWNTPFPNTGLGTQMKMIARLIQARGPAAFNMHRQIFFCSVGGYDTHTNQVTFNNDGSVTPTTGTHANLLGEVSDCVFAFQRAMEQLGLSDKVTTFTASDFARTFPTNSQGSDHGWGAHHIVCGGAVQGGQTYGHLPILAINGPTDTGLGRWIPTTAVDQHAATLARWFGVDEGNLATIFPNLTRFAGTQYGSDVGFMG